MKDPDRQLTGAAAFVRKIIPSPPDVALVLGSGLAGFADTLQDSIAIPTSSIPHYPSLSVEGHAGGKLVFATLSRHMLVALQGRVHYYECGDMWKVLFPIRLLQLLGVSTLVITNAAGGVNRGFSPGDLMVITDQINLTLTTIPGNSLSRPGQTLYSKRLSDLAFHVGSRSFGRIRKGVYVGVKGPSYETAAEIEMIRRIGGDAVGMSTVNEVSLASSLGIEVVGISCITNYATGIHPVKLDHSEVTIVANSVRENFASLITSLVAVI